MNFLWRQTLSRILYHFGDIVSLTILRVGWGWKVYQKAMMKSLDLDREGVIWKEVRQEAEWGKADQYLAAKQTFSYDPIKGGRKRCSIMRGIEPRESLGPTWRTPARETAAKLNSDSCFFLNTPHFYPSPWNPHPAVALLVLLYFSR